MVVAIIFKSPTPASPEQSKGELNELQQAYLDGNPLAAHEAIGHCRDNKLPPPQWVTDALQTNFINFYSGNVFGKKGKGNSVLGDYMKLVKGLVRARAYQTVRRWHGNPNTYGEMPRRLILEWYGKKVTWPEKAVVADALRHAHIGLLETKFQARMSTIKKARSLKLPESLTFGEMQAELDLGLRDEIGIFGAPDIAPKEHIKTFLKLQAPFSKG